MASSPLDTAGGIVMLDVRAAGVALPTDWQILSVDVRRHVGMPSEARIVLYDGDPASQEFPVMDGTELVHGSEIRISAAYDSDAFVPLFEGIVVSQRLRISDTRGSRLEITCRDAAFKMTLQRKTALFEQQTDGDIASALIGDAGLTAQVELAGTSTRAQVQHMCSDWDFLRCLADRGGMLLEAHEGKVRLFKPDFTAQAVLTLSFGTDVLGFDAEITALSALTGATATAWDDAQQQTVPGATTAFVEGKMGDLTMSALSKVGEAAHETYAPFALESAELKAQAEARMLRGTLAAISGRCSFPGSALPKPGDMLEITGLGKRMSGQGFLSGVEHSIRAGAWTTEAFLGLSPEWASEGDALSAPGAGGLAATIPGLYVAKVVKTDADPQGGARIQVNLPLSVAGDVLLWARFAAPYAGDKRGMMFLPEIDDEVLVGFLADAPDAPVVLGALHSSKFARPAEPDESNSIKTIETFSGLKIVFDETDRILTLQTPDGAIVTMDDAQKVIQLTDQGGNVVKMSDAGIALTSTADITIAASGKVEITAGADATLSGVNVTAEAQAQLTAKGGSGAELSAGGQTVVSGAMVMIN